MGNFYRHLAIFSGHTAGDNWTKIYVIRRGMSVELEEYLVTSLSKDFNVAAADQDSCRRDFLRAEKTIGTRSIKMISPLQACKL